MNPATPLPWPRLPYQTGDRDRETIKVDDAYELHAANAYPKLVAALRGIALSYPTTEEGETLANMAQDAITAAGETL